MIIDPATPSHAALGLPSAHGAGTPGSGLRRLIAHAAAARLDLAAAADGAGLALLLLAIGTLLLRPGDLVPAMAGVPLYELLVGGCLVASLPRLLPQLTARALRENAVTALFLLMVPAVVLSHLAHANTYDARFGGLDMAKACLLFLLVVGVVDSPRRLRAVLWTVLAGVVAMAALAVLQRHGLLYLGALRSIEQRSIADGPAVLRLCGIGVFNDPNDFALILVTAIIIGVYGLGDGGAERTRWLMLAPLALLVYALALTHSRGGLVAAAAALLAYLPARFGYRRTLPLAILLVPVLAAPFWSRLSTLELHNPEDTFQTRLELWNHSLDAFRSAPLLGIGQGRLVDTIGQVAHNSYLHAFAELGLLGGTAFLGGFYLVIRCLWRSGPADAPLARLRPYALAMTVGYAAGMLSLSRCYTVPTQLIPALATAYLVMSARAGGAAIPRFGSALGVRLSGLGLAFLLATLVFVRLLWLEGAA